MNIVGKFHVTDTFTHRVDKGEWVIVGNLVGGTIVAGNLISFVTKMGENTLCILQIEEGQTISGSHFTSLLIELDDQSDLSELKTLRDTEINIQSI